MTREKINDANDDDINTMRILFNALIGDLCNQCRHNDAEEMEGIRDRLIKRLIEKNKDYEWIPVSERLPEEDGQYLITVKYKHVNDSYDDVYAEHGEWYDGRWDMFYFAHCGEVEDIIAWQPLPEPYKAESEDKE